MNSPLTEETSSPFDKFLNDHPQTDFVRVYWLDFSARLRVKVITRKFCQDLAANGSCLTAGRNCLNKIVDTSISAGGLNCGTNAIYPDWPTLRPCPHSPGHASVLSTVRHVGDNFEFCPRTAVKRMQAKLKELAITTAVGFEIELAIFEGPAEAPQPLETVTGWLDSAVLRSKYLVVLEEIVRALEASAIPVREFHLESGSQGT
jgi:glutamine synthetase